MPVVVVVDTNFITIPAQFAIDIFQEAESIIERKADFHIISSVIEEIDRKIAKAKKKSEERRFRIAKSLAEKCKLIQLGDELQGLPVDDQIIEYALSVRGVVATNDRDLRRRARSQGIPVLMLRSRKHLILEGIIL
ncbi:MAG: Ribonuclease VapC9 [Candidatus Thorarchaeota archaeon]|nr:MAG: Ribonuclease VapC9 [Candidatus Thorarchaeota archaeon]